MLLIKFLYKQFLSLILVTQLFVPLNAQNAKKDKTQKEIIHLRVDGLSCPFCAYGLEKKLESIEGVNKVDIRLNEGTVKMYTAPKADIDSVLLKEKIDEAGFTLKKFEKISNNDGKNK